MNPTHFEELLAPDGCPGLGRISPLTPTAVCHQEVISNLKRLRWTGHTLGRRAAEGSVFVGKLQTIRCCSTWRCRKDDHNIIVRMMRYHAM